MSLRIKTEDGDIVVADVSGGGGGSNYEVIKVETTEKTITAPEGACYFALAKTEGMSTWVEDTEIYGQNLSDTSSFSVTSSSYSDKMTLPNITDEFDSIELSFDASTSSSTDTLYFSYTFWTDGSSSTSWTNISTDPRSCKLSLSKPIKTIQAGSNGRTTIRVSNISYRTKNTHGYKHAALKSIEFRDNSSISIRNNSFPDYDVTGNIFDYDSNKYLHNYKMNSSNTEIIPLEEPEQIELMDESFPYEITGGEVIEFLSTSDYPVPVTLYFKKKVN